MIQKEKKKKQQHNFLHKYPGSKCAFIDFTDDQNG